jgi:hypothetical protein
MVRWSEDVDRLDAKAGEESKMRVEEVYPFQELAGEQVVPLGGAEKKRRIADEDEAESFDIEVVLE